MIKSILLICSMSIFLSIFAQSSEFLDNEKAKEMSELDQKINKSLARIRATSESRAGDYLTLLPTVTVSRSAPTSDIQGSETYIGGSISLNGIFSISDASNKRAKLKREGERKVKSLEYQITTLINRKYILKRKVWQKSKIKKALTNPLEIAKYDDDIDDLNMRIEEISMKIEQQYAEIDYVCIEVEG